MNIVVKASKRNVAMISDFMEWIRIWFYWINQLEIAFKGHYGILLV